MTKNFYCSDPLDRVYSLVGLASDYHTNTEIETYKFDYSRSMSEVCEEVVLQWINDENLLDHILDFRTCRNGATIPSWIPDFGALRSQHVVKTGDSYSCGHRTKKLEVATASPSWDCLSCNSLHRRQDWSSLQVRGVTFDYICSLVSFETMAVDFSRTFPGFMRQLVASLGVYKKADEHLPIEQMMCIGFLMSDFVREKDTSIGQQAKSLAEEIGQRTASGLSGDYDWIKQLALQLELGYPDAAMLDMKMAFDVFKAFIEKVRSPATAAHKRVSGQVELPKHAFFRIQTGFIGYGPASLKIADQVIVAFGYSRPLLIRSHACANENASERVRHFELVGDAVVPGIMAGQMVRLYEKCEVLAENFLIC